MRTAPLTFVAVAAVVLAIAAGANAQLRVGVHASVFTTPVAFVQDPTDRSVQFVVEQGGLIRTVRAGQVQATPFLDLTAAISSGGERGLLGLAFAPDYATSGRFYVNFTNPAGHTVVARFRRSGNPLVADAASRFDLRWGGAGGVAFIEQPFANHNGGHLAFGPDGFLYIGTGDGGSGSDPLHRAQDPASLLGKMLRVDVGVADGDPIGYRVPAGNPFTGGQLAGVRPEIWSFGWRNPWRYSFDNPALGGTGALIVGDVGQNVWEELDYEPRLAGGRNYGWRNREGAHDHVTSQPPAYLPLTDPIHEYDHTVGSAITGGYVYRGGQLSASFRGRYFFADFGGRVWSLGLTINPLSGEATAAGLTEHTAELSASTPLGTISSFGVDADGELYIVGYTTGQIFKIMGPLTAPPTPGARPRADAAIYRPSTGEWYILRSSSGNTAWSVFQWGLPSDIPTPGDFDGDRLIDPAVYRPSTGQWYVLRSSNGYAAWNVFQWGLPDDTPTPADFDGDRRIDPAVYRPSTGQWFILRSSSGYAAWDVFQWGLPNDVPTPGDYDGDGLTDAAVFRPSESIWYVRPSSGPAAVFAVAWGVATDLPTASDYDGDGRTDIAVYRPSSGTWYILTAASGFRSATVVTWGVSTDRPVPADFDGDGQSDIAVYRPSTGTWFVLQSSAGNATWVTFQWGLASDVPLPANFDGDGTGSS